MFFFFSLFTIGFMDLTGQHSDVILSIDWLWHGVFLFLFFSFLFFFSTIAWNVAVLFLVRVIYRSVFFFFSLFCLAVGCMLWPAHDHHWYNPPISTERHVVFKWTDLNTIQYFVLFFHKIRNTLPAQRNLFSISNCVSIIYVYRRNLTVFFCIAQNCKQMMPERKYNINIKWWQLV